MLGHRMLDDMFDYLTTIRNRPVWQDIPDDIRQSIHEPLPVKQGNLPDIYQDFLKNILPYTVGNIHPAFMGWVHGGGTAVGMLAEMLAAGLNANLGGRNQMPVEVERQIASWMRELFGFPEDAGGLFVTGTSIANFLAVLAARTSFSGSDVRQKGVGRTSRPLIAYTSVMAHKCISQAMDMAGIGIDCLRVIETDENYRMQTKALESAIAKDFQSGLAPFLIIATAGTVDVGSVDNIAAVADIAEANSLWLHVDGAYGALARLSPELSPKLSGIERANSIAFDFHKWGQVPYDAGFILVRDINDLQNTFGSPAAYLQRESRGLAGGSPWPCDLGPDLSRGFRALKTWFTFKAYGTRRLGAMIEQTCSVASYLKRLVEDSPDLELLAPVALNIVCFRFRCQNADAINRKIVIEIQESGIAAPSTTTIGAHLAIRAAIVNHRTQYRDIDAFIDAVLGNGRKFSNSYDQSF
jgi:glutamate/tyrosine decarboxylase-like PLP-dependent enzyme